MARPNAVAEMLSFSGRVRRIDWWLIGIGLSFLQGILALVTAGALGDHSLGRAPTDNSLAQQAQLALAVVFLWPITAVSVKRAHDRNGAGFAPILYTVLTLGLLVAQVIRPEAFDVTTEVAFGAVDIAIMAASVTTLVLIAWMLITLGFLRGTPGPNQYGPSPFSSSNYRAPPTD